MGQQEAAILSLNSKSCMIRDRIQSATCETLLKVRVDRPLIDLYSKILDHVFFFKKNFEINAASINEYPTQDSLKIFLKKFNIHLSSM